MDRRDSMKSLLVGSLAGGLVLKGCTPTDDETEEQPTLDKKYYGRTPKERYRDDQLKNAQFLTVHELETIATLCDLILPATDQFGSAVEAGVPEFIEFMAKDIPNHQLPLRGGIMWLDSRTNKLYNKVFKACSEDEHKHLLDQIAYPVNGNSDLLPGVKFFSLMRDLTLTGYYTTRMGLDELGYKGNTPNVWDGVPDEVLKDHSVDYDKEWLAKCLDTSTRDNKAEWDDQGNLIS